MRTGQTYHTREIETMLRSKQGQAKLRSTLEQTRLLPIDFLGEDGAPESAQQILEHQKPGPTGGGGNSGAAENPFSTAGACSPVPAADHSYSPRRHRRVPLPAAVLLLGE